MRTALLTVFSVGAFLPVAATAQNIDAAAQIQNLLTKHGAVPYTHQVPHTQNQTSCHTMPCHAPTGDMCSPTPVCTTYPVTTYTPQTDQIIPTASNIRIISAAPVTFDPLVTTSVPDQLTVTSQEFVNCASIPNVQAINLTVAFTKTTSLALSNSVTNTSSYSMNFNWSPVDSFSLGGSATFGSSQTTGTVNTTGVQMTTTRQSSSQATLATGQAIVAQIEVYPVTLSQTFHSTVTVDADLSPNDQFAHLSDMYSDPAMRTFPVAGAISITDASDGKTETFDAPDEPTACNGHQSGVVQIPYTPSALKPLMLRMPEAVAKPSKKQKAADKKKQSQ